MDQLPFSQACENNKASIIPILREVFAGCEAVLEVASGTGQHACHFVEQLPWLTWQPTEMEQHIQFLQPRCSAFEGDRLLPPVQLDVCNTPWPVAIPQAVFTANSLHIMPYSSVEKLFEALADAPMDAVLAIYGPFNYGGRHTSDSNAGFDQWLMQQNPLSAIRDFEAVDGLARNAGFVFQQDCEMPANNRLLVWCRELE